MRKTLGIFCCPESGCPKVADKRKKCPVHDEWMIHCIYKLSLREKRAGSAIRNGTEELRRAEEELRKVNHWLKRLFGK